MAGGALPRTKAHVVLGSGGVKTLAYVGALEVLAQAGIEFVSVSACSAGSLIGALVATGAPMDVVRARVEATDLRRLLSRTELPGALRYAARRPLAPCAGERPPSRWHQECGAALAIQNCRFERLTT